MRVYVLTLLLAAVAVLRSPWSVPGAMAASVLERTPQQVTPQVPRPQPNPNALKTDPSTLKTLSFLIGYVIPSRAGFQACSPPAGYSFSWSYSELNLRIGCALKNFRNQILAGMKRTDGSLTAEALRTGELTAQPNTFF